jgi:hypothetical protein
VFSCLAISKFAQINERIHSEVLTILLLLFFFFFLEVLTILSYEEKYYFSFHIDIFQDLNA